MELIRVFLFFLFPSHSLRRVKMILIGRISTRGVGEGSKRRGTEVRVEDWKGFFLKMAPSASLLDIYHLPFISTEWSYIPCLNSRTGSPKEERKEGHLEISSSFPLPHSLSPLLLSSLLPSSYTLEQVFDFRKSKFRDLKSDNPFSPSLSSSPSSSPSHSSSFSLLNASSKLITLKGKVTRIAGPLYFPSSPPAVFILLQSSSGHEMTIVVNDQPETRHTVTQALLLKEKSFCLLSSLKPSISHPNSISPRPQFISTSDTFIIPLDHSNEEGEEENEILEPSFISSFTPSSKRRKLEGDEYPRIGREGEEKKRKEGREEEEKKFKKRNLMSHVGIVSKVINSNTIEMDEKYTIMLHRVGGIPKGVREGAKIRISNGHPLFEHGAISGLFLCAKSRVEIIELSKRGDINSWAIIEERTDEDKFPTLSTALQAETLRRRWLQNIPDIKYKSTTTIMEWLVGEEGKKGNFSENSSPAHTSRSFTSYQLTSSSSSLLTWYEHELGCEAEKGGTEKKIQIYSLSFFRQLNAIASFPQKIPSHIWNYEILNPEGVKIGKKEKSGCQASERLLVGRIVAKNPSIPSIQSNFVWFEEMTGHEGEKRRIPIVIPGIRIKHLQIPCRLSNCIVIKESIVTHYGVSRIMVEKRGEERKNISLLFSSQSFQSSAYRRQNNSTKFDIYEFYLFCPLENVVFLYPEESNSTDLHDASNGSENTLTEHHVFLNADASRMREDGKKEMTIEFEILKVFLPIYDQPSVSTSSSIELLIKPIKYKQRPLENNDPCSLIIQSTDLCLAPLLHPFSKYRLSYAEKKQEFGKTVYRCSRRSLLTEIGKEDDFGGKTSLTSHGGHAEESNNDQKNIWKMVDIREMLSSEGAMEIKEKTEEMMFRGIIISRNHEWVWKSVEKPSTESKFYKPMKREGEGEGEEEEEEEREVRSNFGEISILIRSISSPDTIIMYFKADTTSLPLGLVPGMVLEVGGASMEVTTERGFSSLPSSNNQTYSSSSSSFKSNDTTTIVRSSRLYIGKMISPRMRSIRRSSLRVICFDPSISSLISSSASEGSSSSSSPNLVSFSSLLSSSQHILDLPIPSSSNCKIKEDENGVRRMSKKSLEERMVGKVEWNLFFPPSLIPSSPSLPFPPYRHISDFPNSVTMDRRSFRTIVTLEKVIEIYWSSRCLLCGSPSLNSVCTEQCVPNSPLEVVVNGKMRVNDGTGRVNISSSSPSSLASLIFSSSPHSYDDDFYTSNNNHFKEGNNEEAVKEEKRQKIHKIFPPSLQSILNQIVMRFSSLAYNNGQLKLSNGTVPIEWEKMVMLPSSLLSLPPSLVDLSLINSFQYHSDLFEDDISIESSDSESEGEGEKGELNDDDPPLFPRSDFAISGFHSSHEDILGQDYDDENLNGVEQKAGNIKKKKKGKVPSFRPARIRPLSLLEIYCLFHLRNILRDNGCRRSEVIGFYYAPSRKFDLLPFPDLPYSLNLPKPYKKEGGDHEEGFPRYTEPNSCVELRRYMPNLEVVWARPFSSSPIPLLLRAQSLLNALSSNPNHSSQVAFKHSHPPQLPWDFDTKREY